MRDAAIPAESSGRTSVEVEATGEVETTCRAPASISIDQPEFFPDSRSPTGKDGSRRKRTTGAVKRTAADSIALEVLAEPSGFATLGAWLWMMPTAGSGAAAWT